MIDHGQPLSTMVNHGQAWLTMFHKINYGSTSHCDKDCLNMKINQGQPWLTMFILGFIIVMLVFI